MANLETCEQCGHALDVLREPVKRLRWTRYWWRGFVSWFTGPLRICAGCGAMYSNEGELVAQGVVATEPEERLNTYRKDMAHLRDSFAAVVIAAELIVVWLVVGVEGTPIDKIILAGGVGAGSLLPFAYFARKARIAKQKLKALRTARQEGRLRPGDN